MFGHTDRRFTQVALSEIFCLFYCHVPLLPESGIAVTNSRLRERQQAEGQKTTTTTKSRLLPRLNTYRVEHNGKLPRVTLLAEINIPRNPADRRRSQQFDAVTR